MKYSDEFVKDIADSGFDFGIGLGIVSGILLLNVIYFITGLFLSPISSVNSLMFSSIVIIIFGCFYLVRGIHLRKFKMWKKEYAI